MKGGFPHQQNVFFRRRTDCPYCLIICHAPEEISAQNAVQGYQSICCSSMADHFVFYCHFVYSPKVLRSTANQNASETYLELMKPDEDHSFLQRVPKINAQSLKQNGLWLSPSFLSLMLYLVFYLLHLLFFSYKNYEKILVKVVDEISEKCKQFLLRQVLCVQL